MIPRVYIFLSLFLLFGVLGCKEKQYADLVLTNATIYSVDESNSVHEALAIQSGQILAIGVEKEIMKYVGPKTRLIDIEGNTVIPGFIEGHAHFIGLGEKEMNLDLSSTENYQEVITMVAEAAREAEPGEWIMGRGWHQSKWNEPTKLIKGFPIHDSLSMVSPDNPVILSHASGHASLVNQKAMDIAGINALELEVSPMSKEGHGEVIRDELGNPTGLFNEMAEELILKHIPEKTDEYYIKAIIKANEACHRNGITSFHDAGNSQRIIDLYKQSIDSGDLTVRMYVMLSGSDSMLLTDWYEQGPLIGYGNDQLTVRSIKMYMDGALGSRGAWLLEPYEDRAGHFGHATTDPEALYPIAENALLKGFQVCSHAIGDRANQEVLNTYEKAFKRYPEHAKDHRFRIEHAQHIAREDIGRFASLGVIPAMQAIHMSSDRPWAIYRLGLIRIKEGAYVWQKLLESGAVIVNGTDAPVEPVSPIACYYASVTRKTLKGQPEGGYESAQKMSREQALRSYTIDAAYGAFEEDAKGSLEVGKLADITILNQDILKVKEEKLLETKILMTLVGGEIVYERN